MCKRNLSQPSSDHDCEDELQLENYCTSKLLLFNGKKVISIRCREQTCYDSAPFTIKLISYLDIEGNVLKLTNGILAQL